MRVLVILREFNKMSFEERQHLLANYKEADLIEANSFFMMKKNQKIVIGDVTYIKDFNQDEFNYEFISFIELNENIIKQIKG